MSSRVREPILEGFRSGAEGEGDLPMLWPRPESSRVRESIFESFGAAAPPKNSARKPAPPTPTKPTNPNSKPSLTSQLGPRPVSSKGTAPQPGRLAAQPSAASTQKSVVTKPTPPGRLATQPSASTQKSIVTKPTQVTKPTNPNSKPSLTSQLGPRPVSSKGTAPQPGRLAAQSAASTQKSVVTKPTPPGRLATQPSAASTQKSIVTKPTRVTQGGGKLSAQSAAGSGFTQITPVQNNSAVKSVTRVTSAPQGLVRITLAPMMKKSSLPRPAASKIKNKDAVDTDTEADALAASLVKGKFPGKNWKVVATEGFAAAAVANSGQKLKSYTFADGRETKKITIKRTANGKWVPDDGPKNAAAGGSSKDIKDIKDAKGAAGPAKKPSGPSKAADLLPKKASGAVPGKKKPDESPGSPGKKASGAVPGKKPIGPVSSKKANPNKPNKPSGPVETTKKKVAVTDAEAESIALDAINKKFPGKSWKKVAREGFAAAASMVNSGQKIRSYTFTDGKETKKVVLKRDAAGNGWIVADDAPKSPTTTTTTKKVDPAVKIVDERLDEKDPKSAAAKLVESLAAAAASKQQVTKPGISQSSAGQSVASDLAAAMATAAAGVTQQPNAQNAQNTNTVGNTFVPGGGGGGMVGGGGGGGGPAVGAVSGGVGAVGGPMIAGLIDRGRFATPGVGVVGGVPVPSPPINNLTYIRPAGGWGAGCGGGALVPTGDNGVYKNWANTLPQRLKPGTEYTAQGVIM